MVIANNSLTSRGVINVSRNFVRLLRCNIDMSVRNGFGVTHAWRIAIWSPHSPDLVPTWSRLGTDLVPVLEIEFCFTTKKNSDKHINIHNTSFQSVSLLDSQLCDNFLHLHGAGAFYQYYIAWAQVG